MFALLIGFCLAFVGHESLEFLWYGISVVRKYDARMQRRGDYHPREEMDIYRTLVVALLLMAEYSHSIFKRTFIRVLILNDIGLSRPN